MPASLASWQQRTEVQRVSVGVWVRVYKHVQVENVLADSASGGGEPGATRLWD